MFSTCAGAVHQVVEDSMQIALPVLKPNPQLRASSSAKEVARNTQTCGPWRLLLASHSISDDLLMRHMGQPLSEQVVGEMMPCMQNNSCNRRAVMTTPSQTNAHLSSGVPSASAGKNSSARPTRGAMLRPRAWKLVAPPAGTSFRYTSRVAWRWKRVVRVRERGKASCAFEINRSEVGNVYPGRNPSPSDCGCVRRLRSRLETWGSTHLGVVGGCCERL